MGFRNSLFALIARMHETISLELKFSRIKKFIKKGARKMKKKIITVGILSMFAVGMFHPVAEARNIGSINMTLSFGNGDLHTPLIGKTTNTRVGVVNLTGNNHSIWVVATMKNSANAHRGTVSMASNVRREFTQTSQAAAGYVYKLGLRTTSSPVNAVRTTGSWSPDR